MKSFILIDRKYKSFLPFTYTRPISEIRVGILKIKEKWELFLNGNISYMPQEKYLSDKFPTEIEDVNIFVFSDLLPDKDLAEAINNLSVNQALLKDSTTIAICVKKDFYINKPKFEPIFFDKYVNEINGIWDIFYKNGQQIEADFDLITAGRTSQPLSKTNMVIGNKDKIFVEEGAELEYTFLNTNEGHIYIGKDSKIMEGAKIRAPFAMCQNSLVKMDAKIYKDTSIGKYCKVGGEISNVVFFDYSNKGHDGFLGNSVIGEWCNLGADTNTSNLRNNYNTVKIWSFEKETFVDTGLQFCGLFLGDHSKTGINTMFNTGTVVGMSCNIFGEGFPRTFIRSFQWGGNKGFVEYKINEAIKTAKRVMKRRDVELSEIDEKIFGTVFERTTNK